MIEQRSSNQDIRLRYYYTDKMTADNYTKGLTNNEIRE
jgi:hypothetical protein